MVYLKLWWLGTRQTAALLAKVGEVLMLVETVVGDTVDALQVGWCLGRPQWRKMNDLGLE